MKWITGHLNRIWELSFSRETYLNSKDYQEAAAWFHQFQPQDDTKYVDALKYAESKFKACTETYDLIDKKAEWAIGSSTAVIGALLAFYEKLTMGFVLVAIPIALLLVSIFLALKARIPELVATPSDVKDVVKFNEDGNSNALTAASLHCVVKGKEWSINRKADRLSYAIYLFYVAIISLCVIKLIASLF